MLIAYMIKDNFEILKRMIVALIHNADNNKLSKLPNWQAKN